MNLNELVINPGKGRGKKGTRGKIFGINKLSPASSTKRYSSPSSDLNWGKSHISVPITPSTVQKSVGSSKVSSEEDSRVVVALTEGRGEARCEVGIAAINVCKPFLILCQISDTQSYTNTLTKINIFNPHEILVPITFVENFSGNRLIDKVKQQFPHIKYTGVARSTFNKNAGKEILSELCIPDLNAILLALQHRYYALAASAALITYVQDNLFIYYASGSIKIDYQESEGYTIIDVSTADRLELVCSTKPAQGNRYSSLFGILNHCQTKMGTRKLRSAILQPPCNVKYIEERLDCVTELAKRPEALLSIQALLQKVPNIDVLLGIATIIPNDPQRCSNRQLNYILLLNSLLDLITPLGDVVSKLKRPFYQQLKGTLESEEFSAIRDIVRTTIQDGAHPAKGQAGVMQRCFAIKPGINGLLDLVRKTYSERIDDMREYVKSLAEKYDLALTLANNQSKGHHMVLTLTQQQKRYMKKSDLPEEFIHVNRLVGSFTMKTPELINLSTRLDDIMRDVLTISNVMMHSIIVEIKKYVGLFYKLCEELAHLDVLQSLAEASVRNGYSRPMFGEFTEIAFAHHPLLDFLLSTKPISNHISCSSDFNVHIITGPNGSGKSIFIRQVALLQVMAQVGCYVPAQTAVFRPADRIYARIYLEDNMEYGASSFMLEMKEIEYIMTTMTENSLIIIDELCRSTSLEEGTALAIAILEKLAQTSAFIYITTHYTLLTKLYDMYLNVKIWHLETLPSGEDPRSFKLDFRHNLIPGITSVKHYGVYIVRNIWPDNILKYVYKMLDKLTKKHENPKFLPIDEKLRLKYSVEAEFKRLKSQKKLTVAEINKILNQYQNDLQNLGYSTVNVDSFQESMPQIRHSIFDNTRNIDASYNENPTEEDLQSMDERMRQIFTPEPSLCSQASADVETQRAEEKMRSIFTPENSQQSFNFQKGSSFTGNDDCASQSSRYRNISNFLGENSENINKLVPQVDLSYDTSSSSQLAQNVFGLFGLDFPKQDPRPSQPSSSIDLSQDMDQFRFSAPLRKDFSKTSTPVAKRESCSKNSSPAVQIYSQRRNFSTPSSIRRCPSPKRDQEKSKTMDEIELESIREELEICSKVFEEDDGDFENSVFCKLENEETKLTTKESKYQHLMPTVRIIEGPNNASLSFGEEPEDPRRKKKINIIANVLVSPRDGCDLNEPDVKLGDRDEVEAKQNCQVERLQTHESPTSAEEVDMVFETWSRIYDEQFMKYIESKVRDGPAEDLNVAYTEDNSDETLPGQQVKIESRPSNSDPVQELLEDLGEDIMDEESEEATLTCYGAAMDQNQDHIPTKTDSKESPGEDNISIGSEEEKLKPSENLDSSTNVNRTAITSISNASKQRNLDQVTSDSSPQEEKTTSTSISSVSRKRNLDKVTSDSSLTEEAKKESKGGRRRRPLKQTEETVQTKKALPNRRKFVPPRKLSAKEIREEFEEQDRRILETSPSSSNFSKYLEQLIKRPSVKQIQNTTHVAYITKTDEGIHVIPAPPKRRRKKSPIKRHFSKESFDISIFSDQNALPFEQYLNSKEKDYDTFSFNFKKGGGDGDGGKKAKTMEKFEFLPSTANNLGEYTNNSVTMRFVRNSSDAFRSQSDRLRTSSEMGLANRSQTLTPDGFYKQNKEDINRIVDKYLASGGRVGGLQNAGPSANRSMGKLRSFFENDDLNVSDLDI